jgi:hypothetical protein
MRRPLKGVTVKPVARIVVRPCDDETKAIVGITRGADATLVPGTVYEIKKDTDGRLVLHPVGLSCIGEVEVEKETRRHPRFSWAHRLGDLFDCLGTCLTATVTEMFAATQHGIMLASDWYGAEFPPAGDVPALASKRVSAVFAAIDDGELDEAASLLDRAEETYGLLPMLTRARVALMRKEMYAKEPTTR